MKVRIGTRVRLVTMQGCMGHIRTGEREGVVVGFVTRDVYGSIHPIEYMQIQLDNGQIVERASERRLWSVEYDGIPEYQE